MKKMLPLYIFLFYISSISAMNTINEIKKIKLNIEITQYSASEEEKTIDINHTFLSFQNILELKRMLYLTIAQQKLYTARNNLRYILENNPYLGNEDQSNLEQRCDHITNLINESKNQENLNENFINNLKEQANEQENFFYYHFVRDNNT